jgi:hypothetical protein
MLVPVGDDLNQGFVDRLEGGSRHLPRSPNGDLSSPRGTRILVGGTGKVVRGYGKSSRLGTGILVIGGTGKVVIALITQKTVIPN